MASSTSSSRIPPTLKKGTACLNCRQRKIKCDGARPICRPCAQSDAFQDCEYADSGTGTTQSQVLEAQVNALQQRINQLELSKTPARGQHTSHRSSEVQRQELMPRHPQFPSEFFESAVHKFLAHCIDVGFFLNITRFRDSIFTKSPVAGTPIPALLAAVHLWGIHLGFTGSTQANEQYFLERAVHLAASGLAGAARDILHCIQTEVLLANYFYRNARVVEGKYHADTALSLALGSGLHHTRSASRPSATSMQLPPPLDATDEGERINGFWTVIALNGCWYATECGASVQNGLDGVQSVDTPWPLDMYQYIDAPYQPHYKSSGTIQALLDGKPQGRLPSNVALYIQACVLLENAARIGFKFNPAPPNQSAAARFYASFDAIERSIDNFIQGLAPIEGIASRTSASWALSVHTIAHAAMIRLHAPFTARNPNSRARIIPSVRAIVRLIQGSDLVSMGAVDAKLTMVWTMICKVLITEAGGQQEPAQLLKFLMSSMTKLRTPLSDLKLEDLKRRCAAHSLSAVSTS
ncbi:hypothetical protein CYLTODRAFT_488502 [Cylindrobasidium torrendii FP15055 ss-10]|uniref:Zn(2)-C6 fungal-type domain-containing protein n=1 Tax=Cylindrobasidium torrendii FP15055 ss-10 TaxID=1314674 RepID=A0A0D7BI45_9AGAR|nr:hypothetical protein CYLTODRAFT_488502 [Cylindrobasidium torrendii FP15055 ss-10]